MGICEYGNQLTAYVDGELNAGRRAALEAHLRDCAVCDLELQELRGLSRLFALAQGPFLPAGAMRRLHGRVADLEEEQEQAERTERRVLRITRILTGIAACLLLAGSLWLSRSRQPNPADPHGSVVLATPQESVWDLPATPVDALATEEKTLLAASSDSASPADATADWMVGGLMTSSALPGPSGSAGEGNE